MRVSLKMSFMCAYIMFAKDTLQYVFILKFLEPPFYSSLLPLNVPLCVYIYRYVYCGLYGPLHYSYITQSHLALGLSSRTLYCTKDREKDRSDRMKKKKT